MAAIAETLAVRLRRPSYQGWWSWITTVDHKRIGILYGFSAFIFFTLGGLMALLVRLQLAMPGNTFLGAETYNQVMTMHALVMVFLLVMPLSAAFFNLIVPLQIGARDVAFPRLNALSYWVFLFGGILLLLSFVGGGGPNAGWFAYANLTAKEFNPGHGMDFYVLGLLVLGTSSMAAAFNFIVTIVNLRAPGMSFMRLPVFTWMTLVTAFLIISAFPVITVALIELLFDRYFGTNFFNPAKGGDPVLWQHLFWLFGHPEVYILILPAMGIISEVLPTFSRKPLFGYPFVVYSGIAIGFVGWGVWAHHMFTVGLGPVADTVFALSTMVIAVPTGVKIFNWLATLWGGSIDLKTPLYFALGFIAMFTIGGISGVSQAAAPADTQMQDTYYVVSHLHYVLFGGSVFALFAGVYYWFPKFTNRLLSEPLGRLHFWLMFIGMNLTFAPMIILGLNGMPRRIYTYPSGMGWDVLNLMATVGAVTIALSVLVFLYNVSYSLRRGERAGNDPWDGRTLEWSIPSPPPIYNFAAVPMVHGRDPYWHQKYVEAEGGRLLRRPIGSGEGYEGSEEEHHEVHVPWPSYFPFVTALGIFLMGAGMVFGYWITGIGLLVMLVGIYGWAFEPVSE